MKVTKPFCIDDDLIVDLKKTNASELVNSLIREHFEGVSGMTLSKLKRLQTEKQKKKASLLKELRQIGSRIKEIEQKEAKVLQLTKSYPDYIFKVMNGCDNVMKLYSAFRNDDRLKKYKWMELKKIYNHLKGGTNS